jgi:hypothetical protein
VSSVHADAEIGGSLLTDFRLCNIVINVCGNFRDLFISKMYVAPSREPA